MNSWYHLNIEQQPLKSDWVYPTVFSDTLRKIWMYQPTEVFTQEWINLLSTYRLYPLNVLLFYCASFWSPTQAHIDHDKSPAPIFALNWVVNGEHSEMIWYNMPDREGEVQNYLIPNSDNYLAWNHSTLTECDRCEILEQPTIVRIDLPHRVFAKENPRWAFSVRFDINLNNWDDVVQHMRTNDILIERT